MGEGANFGMNAGNVLQGYDQAAIDDARARFEGNRDFALNQRKDYMSTMLNRAPNSPSVQPNNFDPTMSGISGAMTGFGFARDMGFGQGNQRIPASAGGVSTSLRPQLRPF